MSYMGYSVNSIEGVTVVTCACGVARRCWKHISHVCCTDPSGEYSLAAAAGLCMLQSSPITNLDVFVSVTADGAEVTELVAAMFLFGRVEGAVAL
jgi:hypothetical protein